MGQLAASDLAIDHTLVQLSSSFRFILDVTPVDADEVKEDFLGGRVEEPVFTYRELDNDPEVLEAQLSNIDVNSVEDPMLGHLLRAKHRELQLQLQMLRARGTDDFRHLSIELYGGVSPQLLESAQDVVDGVLSESRDDEWLDAATFLDLAKREIAAYKEDLPDLEMHAEIREGVSGVTVTGDTLLIGPSSGVSAARANALIQHEVGTHLVTHVNGRHQPIQLLGAGLAGYDETQEGLAVLAEIACGGLTADRLRQLADRVLAVHNLVVGASFHESFDLLRQAGTSAGSAFLTVMRVYRAGGFTKDAIYLRGLLALLQHLAHGEKLDRLWLGKFSLTDLPLVDDLATRGILNPPLVTPRYLQDKSMTARLDRAAAQLTNLPQLIQGATT